MTKNKLFRERITFFLLGMLLVLGAVFLAGAKNDTVIDSGRYRLAAWGDGRAHGAFVMDSISGETKIAYRYKEIGDTRSMERDNLNKPFVKIK